MPSSLLLTVLGPALRGDGSGFLLTENGAESARRIVDKVTKDLRVLQAELLSSERQVGELRDQADALEEKRRILARQAERAEHQRDAAFRRRDQAEAASRQAKEEAAPVVRRYMEAEVIRSQMQVTGEEIERLKADIAACQEELASGLPRLAEAEDAEAECAEAISQLEAAHTEEMAVLRSVHLEEMSELRAEHAASAAEMGSARQEELSSLLTASAEETSRLRAAIDAARWQSDVYLREAQDASREACLRQRETARVAKRHGEHRQEALELAVRLEALRATEAGAPAREAELQAVRQRYVLLEKTAQEWADALDRKKEEVAAWQKRAVGRGSATAEAEAAPAAAVAEGDTQAGSNAGTPRSTASSARQQRPAPGSNAERISSLLASPAVSASAIRAPSSLGASPLPSPYAASFGDGPAVLGGSPDHSHRELQMSALTPSRTPPRRLQERPATRRPLLLDAGMAEPSASSLSARRRRPPQRHGFLALPAFDARPSPRRRALQAPAPQLPIPDLGHPAGDSADAVLGLDLAHPAGDFADAVLHLAKLKAEEPEVRGLAERDRAVKEAENEVVMQAFELDEDATAEAEALLEFEVQRQPSGVARRLREQLEELAASRSGPATVN